MAISNVQKKRALAIAAIGVVLTFMCLALDAGGWLNFIESYLYDKRMTWCQRYSLIHHPPTDRIFHLDIDDESQLTIGKWPWPRQRIAEFLDEIGNAGAKVLFTDILFTDVAKDANGNLDVIGDKALAASIKKMGHVLAPMSTQLLESDEEFTPLSLKMIAELTPDPEMDLPTLTSKIQAIAATNPEVIPSREKLDKAVESRFMTMRQVALYRRVSVLIDQGVADPEQMRAKILPHMDPMISSSPMLDVLREQTERSMREHEMRRFKLPLPKAVPGLAKAAHDSEQIPILDIATQAAYSGFVDPFSVGDKRVRSVVLGVQSDGRVVPHAALAMTCALLGADIQKVRFTPDAVIIPASNDREYVVPVRTARSDTGRAVPLVFDIPWWGSTDWGTMYDWPHYQDPVHHASINMVGEVIHSKDVIARNTQQFYKAMGNLIKNTQSEDDANKFLANPPSGDPLEKLVTETMDFAKQVVTVDDKTFRELPDKDQKMITRMKMAMAAVPLARQEIAKAVIDLKKQRQALQNLLSGNLVLLGWTATGAFDFYPTPLHDRCPGVVALSTIVNGIVTGRTFHTLPYAWTLLFTLVTGLATTALVVTLPPLRSSIYTIALATLYFTINGYVVYDYRQAILGLAGPAAAMVSVWVSLTIVKFTIEIRDRNRLKKRFQSYVDPKLVNYVLEHPDDAGTSGAVKEMSVVFTDLEGFTTLSEALKEKTVPMLSEYMGEMVPLIRSHNGYVNKFLGDGIMFFFNPPCAPDPDHAADAVKSVLDMQRAMDPFNEKLKRQGLPTLNMRVGIVSGEMVVGDAGPENASDYTVLGDNVNLASRLEGANKATGTNTMIHWKTKELLGDRFICRPIGKLMVKGKTEGIMTYEPLGPTILADDRQRKILECSDKIVNAYFAADFDACIAACESMDAELGATKYTKLYRKESEHRKEEFAKDGLDPKNFSGVITLSEK